MTQLVKIPLDDIELEGTLKLPSFPKGIVLFAHGSGSSRFSPRNNFVADYLFEKGLASLLTDLLTKKEDEVYETRFNIPLLTKRLLHVANWVAKTQPMPLGLFGASTGAAAALEAAAVLGNQVQAVVSRGGRPDLAMGSLNRVVAPTLLIVGGADDVVIVLNQGAFEQLQCPKKLEIVPHATHLFEEPGCLEEVARLAASWFLKNF
jgi:putative phosphoribosyl transferase